MKRCPNICNYDNDVAAEVITVSQIERPDYWKKSPSRDFDMRKRYMEHEIDINRLRRDLRDYYGTAMFNVSMAAVMDLAKIDFVSDQELVEIAEQNGVDLRRYIV